MSLTYMKRDDIGFTIRINILLVCSKWPMTIKLWCRVMIVFVIGMSTMVLLSHWNA